MNKIEVAFFVMTLTCSAPVLLDAQAPDTRSTPAADDRYGDIDFGWLGLLGLGGLFGLMRRDRNVDSRVNNPGAARKETP
jgi:MYXO-CTERM domain-containing protein